MGFRSPINGIPPSSITGDLLAEDSVTGIHIAADAITAKHTVTGAVLQTAADGERVVIKNDGGTGRIEFHSGGTGDLPGLFNPQGNKVAMSSPRTALDVSNGFEAAVLLLSTNLAGGLSAVSVAADYLVTSAKAQFGGDVEALAKVIATGNLETDAGVRVAGEHYHHRNRNTDLSVTTGGTWRTINWDNPVTDSGDIAYMGGTFTLDAAGIYLVLASISFSGADVTDKRGLRLVGAGGGGNVHAESLIQAAGAGQTSLAVAALMDGAGSVTAEFFQNSGSNLDILTGSRIKVRRIG